MKMTRGSERVKWYFYSIFRLWKTITQSLGKSQKNLRQYFFAMTMVKKCGKFHEVSATG